MHTNYSQKQRTTGWHASRLQRLSLQPVEAESEQIADGADHTDGQKKEREALE